MPGRHGAAGRCRDLAGDPEQVAFHEYRVAAAQALGDVADAIGKEPEPGLELPAGAGDGEIEALVWRQLRTCFDPEIPFNIVDLGLVYEANLGHREDGQRKVEVKMTLTAPGCGMGEILVDDVRSKLEMIPTVAEADVELVFDPPWGRHMMSEAAKLETGML